MRQAPRAQVSWPNGGHHRCPARIARESSRSAKAEILPYGQSLSSESRWARSSPEENEEASASYVRESR